MLICRHAANRPQTTVVHPIHQVTPELHVTGERLAARLKGQLSGPVFTDPLMTYAWSGDASAYRLIPAAVALINSEDEVRAVIAAARAEHLPITFRAAGASLSGQAVTDGVLAVLGDGWRRLKIHPGAEQITLGPAIIVAHANAALKPYNKKSAPIPPVGSPERSVAWSIIILRACAAASARTPITPWRGCGWC
ncbi:MAG: FAD-binding protein [Candidatus Devosia euplotis]|nr:FAD-binding protein [Candidatus Devosia euplotis]